MLGRGENSYKNNNVPQRGGSCPLQTSGGSAGHDTGVAGRSKIACLHKRVYG